MKKKTIKSIKSFEDACKYMGYDPQKVLPDVSNYPEHHQEALLNHAMLVIIVEALNTIDNDGEKWVPDWNNWDQYKYYPYFKMGSPSGVGFSYLDYAYGRWNTLSDIGSRLCFKIRDTAIYAGEQFEELYKKYMTI